MRYLFAVLVLGVATSACSREPEVAPPSPRVVARRPRSDDPDVLKLRACIDRGRIDEARALLSGLDPSGSSVESELELLRARLEALSGNNVDAIRRIEAARRLRPTDPDVYATAAEIYAAAGKLEAAWEEERAGERACGASPELDRARGVLWISRPGGAEKGLALLESARASDPDLPFLDRALSQAHLLVGKEAAAARRAGEALEHARRAASLDPEDVDVRRFLSEALLLANDFEGGVAELQGLVDRGEPLGAELALLHKKAGIAALLDRDRKRAVGHFLAARRLGLTDEELSTGARVLGEEAGAKVAEGIEAYEKGDLDSARSAFRAALEIEPDRIEAKNSLAVVLFKDADYAAAIELWRAVLETAARESLALPEPVHVNLSKAQALQGDLPAARATLEDYLAREPEGRWAEASRQALLALPARKPGN